jgi:peptide/nickel transport system substrate-binding protein
MKLVRVLALVLVLIMLVVGTGTRAQGVTFVFGWEQEPDLPYPISSSAFSGMLGNFFQRDVWDWLGTDQVITPFMVEEIPSPENGLVTYADVMWDDDANPETPDVAGQAPVVTYRLRQGMLWSDGEPITSADCMFFHNWVMQPDPVDSLQRGFYPDVVAGAEQVDDYTVVLTYKQPWPDYTNNAVLSCALPAHVFLGDNPDGFTMDTDGDGVFDNNADDAPYFQGFDPATLVGYGPYVLSEFNAGSNAVWTLNPNWGANSFEQVPAIDTIITQFILESEQMQNALEVGDIDMAFNFNGSIPADADGNPIGYYAMDNVTVFNTPGVFVDALWMNSGEFAFAAMQDVRVREALVAAIDRRNIAEQFAGPGTGQQLTRAWIAPAFTPPDLPFREYDLDLARQLLTDAGWVDDDGDESAENTAPSTRVSLGVEGVADGTPIVLRFYTTPVIPRPDIQTVIQAQLAVVGVRTQLFVVNGPTVLFANFSDRGILYTGSYDLALYALSNSPLSPNGSQDNFQCQGIPSADNPSGANNLWFCDPAYDALDDQVAVTNDPAERLELRYQAEALFYNASVWHSIRPRPQFYAVRSDRWNPDSMMDVGTLSINYFNRVEFWQPAS